MLKRHHRVTDLANTSLSQVQLPLIRPEALDSDRSSMLSLSHEVPQPIHLPLHRKLSRVIGGYMTTPNPGWDNYKAVERSVGRNQAKEEFRSKLKELKGAA